MGDPRAIGETFAAHADPEREPSTGPSKVARNELLRCPGAVLERRAGGRVRRQRCENEVLQQRAHGYLYTLALCAECFGIEHRLREETLRKRAAEDDGGPRSKGRGRYE